jgi:neutral ceramidase
MKTLPALSLLLLACVPAFAAEPTFRAGAATSNITPQLGLEIIGGFKPFPATHVHDELNARCLVLDDGKTRLALVVCDLLGLHRGVSIEARRLIQAETGIPPERVLISATHTHSATSALGVDAFTSEHPLDDYQRFVARRVADGVKRALNLARPAQVAFVTAEAPEHLFNRRWFMKEGTMPKNPFGIVDKVRMNPPQGSPDLTEPAGPTDPTISIIGLREPSGKPISTFCAYSLHYVGGVGDGHISADYYGMFCEALAKLQNGADGDPPYVAMLANGTSGDVNNIDFLHPRPAKPAYGQMKDVAEDVARRVNDALTKAEWKDGAELQALYREESIPYRTIDAGLMAWAKETEAKGAALDIVTSSYAARVQKLATAPSPAKVPLQVLRIGDIAIGTTPCETFTETGLEFRRRSPIAHSFMVELNHGYIGYLPTPRHFELGGYETWPGTNYLEPQASETMLNALMEMATQLAPKTP